jgi:hypothetical protein
MKWSLRLLKTNYLIVDWHSHRAESEQALAREFFSYAAQRYANVPNIIWEVYTNQSTLVGALLNLMLNLLLVKFVSTPLTLL